VDRSKKEYNDRKGLARKLRDDAKKEKEEAELKCELVSLMQHMYELVTIHAELEEKLSKMREEERRVKEESEVGCPGLKDTDA
jgi:hypothetical protein